MFSKVNIILLFSFFCFSANSTIYYCPNIPERMVVGEKTEQNWFIWPDNEKITTIKIYYYKLFKKSYHFSYWAAFPHGVNKGKIKGFKYFISCCGWLKSENRLICAYKNVKEKNCKAQVMGKEKEYFDCINNEA